MAPKKDEANDEADRGRSQNERARNGDRDPGENDQANRDNRARASAGDIEVAQVAAWLGERPLRFALLYSQWSPFGLRFGSELVEPVVQFDVGAPGAGDSLRSIRRLQVHPVSAG